MQYVKWTEENDWEGEIWNFYIPYEGNEEAIKALAVKLEEYPQGTCFYTLHASTLIDEFDVDVLVKNAECGYMHNHNKMKGIIDINTFIDVYYEDFDEKLYKGNLEYLGLNFVPRP